jgi:hypothetical protein
MASARSVRTEYDLGLPINSSVIEALKRTCLANFSPRFSPSRLAVAFGQF